MKFDIYIASVGGLGALTTSVIIARAANLQGYYVKGFQLHGLAQRSGSTVAMVRIGSEKEVKSSIIDKADLIISFEPLETLKALNYATKKTSVIMNTYKIIPAYSYIENIPYPELGKLVSEVKKYVADVHTINAYQISRESFGDIIYGNLIILGYAIAKKLLPLKKQHVIKAIKQTVKYNIDKNLAALEFGFKLAQQ